MSVQRPNLFQKFVDLQCPLTWGEISEPFFTTCNEAEARTQWIDRICREIFETRRTTGEYPAWYTERGIQFEAAMDGLSVDPTVRSKIGPLATNNERLLDNEGYFNPDGLHLYDREGIVPWIHSRGTCPKCTRVSNVAVSKAFWCYIKYENSNHYLLHPEVAGEFQISSLRTHVQFTQIQQKCIELVSYLIHFAIFTVHSYYAILTIDTLFKTDSSLILNYSLKIHNFLLKYISMIDSPLMFPIHERLGTAPLISELRMYHAYLQTHFEYIPESLPNKLILGFAFYLTAIRIAKLIPLNNRLVQMISRAHTAVWNEIADLVSRIDDFIQPYFLSWGNLVFTSYLRAAFYLVTMTYLCTWILGKNFPPIILEKFDQMEGILVMLTNKILVWESIKSLCYGLNAGLIIPFLRNPMSDYFSLFLTLGYIMENHSTLLRLYSFYATYRDLSNLLKIPNVGRYIPYVRSYIDHPLANF